MSAVSHIECREGTKTGYCYYNVIVAYHFY